MDVASITFVLFALAAALIFHAVANPLYRKTVLTLANLAFIASYLAEVRQVLPLAFFLLFGYGMIELVRQRRSGWALTLGLVFTLALYIFLKRFSFLSDLPTLPFSYLIIGLSYILFRIVHLIVDARSEPWDKPIEPWSYLNYTCNFLTMVSGPIQRYEDFRKGEQSLGQALNADTVYRSFSRIIVGFVKVSVISATANYLFQDLSAHVIAGSDTMPLVKFTVYYGAAAAAYTGYLYFNFSGYMDIVIAFGGLFNQQLPENFNKPFAARSFLEFWNRWHMTLSDWFKIYLFTPLMRLLATNFQSPALLPYLGVIAFFITFLVMGVWHGTTLVFVIYGLLMGAGASVNKMWQVKLGQVLGKKRHQAFNKQSVYIYVCRGLTFAYFTVAVTCLWVDMVQLENLFARLGAIGLAAAMLGLTVVAAFGAVAWDIGAAICARVKGVAIRFENVVTRNLWLASLIVLIAAVSSFYHKAPDFVYRAF
ncbi:MBOAT family O-acyltransferase [Dongia sedimenti]|uniref:Probable alginate O-acetylase AlgI n=1 Tax=Dongia sedimenti TaxID=3064282 RepID=A0ABU0YR62_9PROT|nr:MBOAT family O-acyltransferase [Rhodospirillaceae bacterium R-7]